MNVSLDFYKIFYTVAQYQSISKAAEKLYISQPAVTKTIKKLESELNCALFIRTKKGVTLTEEGTVFYRHIKSGLECFENAEHQLTSLINLETGTLRIGASTTVTRYFLMPYIELFHKKHPKIMISVTNNLTKNLYNDLRNGNLDFLAVNLPTENTHDLELIKSSTLQDCFVASDKFPELKKNKISIHDLTKKYPLIAQKQPSNTRAFLDNFLSNHQISCKPQFDIVSYGLVKQFASAGLGVAYVTKEFTEELKNGKLFEIKLKEKIPERNLGFVLLKNTIPTHATTEFISLIK